jgi:uncharacterized protein YlxP (DUF503 family)
MLKSLTMHLLATTFDILKIERDFIRLVIVNLHEKFIVAFASLDLIFYSLLFSMRTIYTCVANA